MQNSYYIVLFVSDISQKYNQSLDSENSFRNQVQALELEIGDLRRKLNNAVEQCSELQNMKLKLVSRFLILEH